MQVVLGGVVAFALMLSAATAAAEGSLNQLLATLPVLDGRIPTYYTGTTDADARAVQRMIEAASDFYTAHLRVQLPIQVALLGPREWAMLELSLPEVRPGPPYIVCIPRGRSHAIHALVAQVSPRSAAVRALGLADEQLAERFVTLLALHDLGHYYAITAFPSAGGPPPGLSDFVESYLTTAFLAERYPEEERVWQTVMAAFLEHLVEPKSRPRLAGDVHVGSMADSYELYLGSLQARVNAVYRHHGAELLDRLRTVWEEGDPAPALRVLEQVSPGFEEWAAQRHRMNGAAH